MLEQQVLATKIPGFTFKLGFSGRLFGHGNEDEMNGDKALVKNAHVFAWFPHMWSHTKAHTYNSQRKLVSDMMTNFYFAKVLHYFVKVCLLQIPVLEKNEY